MFNKSNYSAGILLICATGLASPLVVAEPSVMLVSAAKASGLEQALKASLKYNPAISGQTAQISAGNNSVDAAKASRLPSMSLSANALDDGYSQGALTLNQPLWTFGKIDSEIEVAKAGYEVQERGLLQVQRNLIQETAISYNSIQNVALKITVAKENVAEHQRLFDRIKRRQKGQLASIADVRLAESRLLQAQSDLLRYEGELESGKNELFALTRKVVDTNQEINPLFLELPDEEETKQKAVKESADVAYAKEEVNLAKANYERSKTEPFPTLSLTMEQVVYSNSDNNVDDFRVGLQLTGQLQGMGVSAYSSIKGSSDQIDAAQYELESVRNEVERQIGNLLVNRDLQEGLRNSQSATVDSLEQTMASFLRQYETNRKTWVEVLNQQRELTNMRHTLITTDQQWRAITLQIASMIGLLDNIAGIVE